LIVLDASLAIEWLFDQSNKAISSNIQDALSTSPVIVPSHWPLEISNTLRPDLRDHKLSIADFHTIMDRLDMLNIRIQHPIDLDEIGPLSQFSVTHGLTAYDAAYVQLALQHQATLATLDIAMRRAATKLNIPLLPAAAL
jgi:predicted nucleic acid-binding protein